MTVDEFDKYMRLGLGRCVTALSSCDGREKFRASVRRACLNNFSYDTQSEGTRAAYVYSLVSTFGDDGYFVAPIVSAFMRKTYHDRWDFCHYCDLLAEFGKRGNYAAKNALYEKYEYLYGRLAVKRPKCGYVDEEAEHYEKLCVILAKLYGKEEYQKIIVDLDKLYEKNSYYDRACFDWFYDCAQSFVGNNEVTENAQKSVVDNREYYFRQPTAAELKLSARLAAASDENERHSVCLDIIKSFSDGADLPDELLDAVYFSRCGCCRCKAVKLMYRRGTLSDMILCECLYDSYEDTREFAKALLKG